MWFTWNTPIAFILFASTVFSHDSPVANVIGGFSVGKVSNNAENKTSWASVPEDELFHPQRNFVKRQLPGDPEPDDPPPTRHGPLFDQGQNCVFCPEQDVLDLNGRQLLNTLTVKKMKTYMRGVPGDVRNKCVFYSKAEEANGPARLSNRATVWACNHDRFSIWHLWPNALMSRQSPNYNDFYGIYEPGNWLYKIKQLPEDFPPYPATRYFENMSQAMAETCTGEVVIITHRPQDMAKYSTLPYDFSSSYENIWGNKERPALRNSFRAGRVTRFYLVDIRTWVTGNEQFPVYDYNINTNQAVLLQNPPFKRWFGDDDNSTDETTIEDIQKRACTRSDGLESEQEGYDYFAGWYRDDY